ncbi:oligosaccharide flippase family protein [Bradyrhizobium diazoefficiens]|uniref:Polysaccharide biosynthesis protein C-terminal domain-containing protein n=2 Tax=Bradyrhizobium diazoefficiens TaxID=1355477 RepID=A0A809X7H1_9BRAD|nr:hypothetical protein XF1B_64930 [Bradyrhizobium diazoefficiens]BCE50071.1 hypothetical protein XF4B_64200 [Bradyrhizobium diazoefficiens]BCE93580.1 hypothetical protein XF10B_63780 [Bradyrhizobium diazoefficiens]BCF28516.1 hypothetical protein XF14B_64680 [Bradyrhizobium diazoefficiens]
MRSGMKQGSGAKRLVGNSIWNVAAFVVGAALNLMILPFAVHRLGVPAFGVASLVVACMAPASIFSSALSLSASRELAHGLAHEHLADSRRLFATAMFLALAVGVLLSFAFALAGPPLARLAFNLPGNSGEDLGEAFAFGASGWLCQCVMSVPLALLIARQDYARISAVTILGTVVATVSMLVLLPARPIPSTFMACQAAGLMAGLATALALAIRCSSHWMAWPAFHREPIRRILHLGSWQVAAQGGALIAAQADRYLLGIVLAPQFVGFYAVAQRLEEAVYIGILKVGEILFPFFSGLHNETDERKAELVFRSSWILNLLAASALGAIVPVAGPLLTMWAGADLAADARHVLIVLTVGGMLGCSVNVFAFFLLAQGRSKSTALISLVTAFFTLTTSAFALPYFGWSAAGWSICVGVAAQNVTTALLLKATFKGISIWPRFVHLVALPLLVGIGTAILLGQLIGMDGLGVHASWSAVGGLYCLSAVAIFVIVASASQFGPYRASCREDLRVIALRAFVWLR